ncbi:cysteine hydrolase family protein [Streptomyces mirabilis]|uniref:cysteine hydrolase family protein n=1 Tax=Streptomyces TaxID=1883 RepID=UPI000BE33F31
MRSRRCDLLLPSVKKAIPSIARLVERTGSALLNQLKAHHTILCGQVTEQCVPHSALDAHIRHLEATVAEDAVAHIHAALAQTTLKMMHTNFANYRINSSLSEGGWPRTTTRPEGRSIHGGIR